MENRLEIERKVVKSDELNTNLDTNFLKVLAIIAMTIDHVGKAFFPDIQIFQVIGRIAFPIFSYCIVVGVIHTSNFKKYLTRLGLFALISQIPWVLAFDPSIYGLRENLMNLNIFFTLFFSAIFVYSMKEKKFIGLVVALSGFCLLPLDYGFDTVLFLASIYLLRDKKNVALIVTSILLLLPMFTGCDINILGLELGLQGFSVLAIPFIFISTNMDIKVNKYFFYAFYPAHLLVIFLIRYFLNI